MNYYEHHLGDWAAATGHLTWDEDMAYTRLLRAYYHHERAIPEGQQYRLAKASTPAQRKAVDQVLAEFFELRDGHHRQKRADSEIARYQDKQRKAKASAEARWSHSGRNANASPDAMRTHSEGNAPRHQTPDTIPKPQAGKLVAAPTFPAPDGSTLPDLTGHEPTPAGLLCRAIKAAGIAETNPGHPDLLRLMAAKIPAESFTATAAELVEKGKGKFALLLKTVEGRWNDAQAAPALAAAAALAPGVSAVAQTAALLAQQAEAGRRANSPEAQAARREAMARVKGVAA